METMVANYETMPERKQTGAYGVDLRKGEVRMDVSRQWANRPADERFLCLSDIHRYTARMALRSAEQDFPVGQLRVADAGEDLNIFIGDREAKFTNWSFRQVCGVAGAPANYMQKLPADLASKCLRYGLEQNTSGEMRAYLYDRHTDPEYRLVVPEPGDVTLRAMTSTAYGRILNSDVVTAVRRFAGNGTGDTRWKVPGELDWSTGRYNPFGEITKRNTTLFASDRDMFLFLVDDTHPIEIGTLDTGNPDLLFRGFYVWNSEVGSRTLGVATMYLRGICCNRILWGVEGFKEITLRHSRHAPEKFIEEAVPVLNSFSDAASYKIVEGIAEARRQRIGDTPEDRLAWITRRGFSKKQAVNVMNAFEEVDGRPVETVWDAVQGISAMARDIPFQDQRVTIEVKARTILDAVA